MADVGKLIAVLEEVRTLLDRPDNDFTWSSWDSREDALAEIDGILSQLRTGVLPGELSSGVLFAPTGPIQEVSVSSGWGGAFVEIASRFDEAMSGDDGSVPGSTAACQCFTTPLTNLRDAQELGMDSRYAEIAVLVCKNCGQHWLRYFYEVEAYTASGRWYLGAITPEQLSRLTPEEAKSILEGLPWYFYGGSFFDGRKGKASGPIF